MTLKKVSIPSNRGISPDTRNRYIEYLKTLCLNPLKSGHFSGLTYQGSRYPVCSRLNPLKSGHFSGLTLSPASKRRRAQVSIPSNRGISPDGPSYETAREVFESQSPQIRAFLRPDDDLVREWLRGKSQSPQIGAFLRTGLGMVHHTHPMVSIPSNRGISPD